MNRQNRGTTALFATLSVLMVVGFSDTAQGQTVLDFNGSTAAPTLNFTVSSGLTATQQIVVTSNTGTTIAVNTNSNTASTPNWTGAPSWLTITPSVNPPNTPVTLTFKVNTLSPVALNNGFTQTATIGIGVSGAQLSAYTVVTVNLTVGTNSSLFSASPSSLSFTGVQGLLNGAPAETPVAIIQASGTALDYALNVSTSDGHNWLVVSPSCSSSASGCVAGTSGTEFEVSVNPSTAGLVPSATAYTGTITAQSTTTADSVSVPVSFTLGASSVLTVTPAAPQSFVYQVGASGPQPSLLTLEVTATGGSVGFTDAVTTTQGSNSWLVPNISSSTASASPTPITLSVNLGGIPSSVGKYTDVLTVTPTNGAAAVPVNVSLVVTTNPILQVGNSQLNFSAQFGGTTAIPAQQVNLTSSGGAVGFTVAQDSTAPWLTAAVVGNVTTASASTPATITFTVNPTGLAANKYTGTILVSPSNGDQYSLPVTVTLTVTSTSTLTSGPPLLHFSWETSQTSPLSQDVQIGSVGQPVSFTISLPATTVTANCPANWLEAGTPTSNTTPATLAIGVVTSGMTAGTCSGTVVVTPASGSGAAALNIPVTIDVSTTALLNVNLPIGFGVQTVAQGAGSSVFQIPLTSTDPVNQVQFTATSNTSWLSVAPTALSSTPQNLQVNVSPSGLTPATYPGTITISSSSLPSATISVPYSLTVTPNITVAVTPAGTVMFTEPLGGPVPQSQTLTLTSTGGSAQYSAQVAPVTGGSWLLINSGTTASGTLSPTGTIALSINPTVANSLSANTYTSTISLAFPGTATATTVVTVNLTVTPQSIAASPTSLSFTYQTGAAAPATQPVNVTSTGGTASFNAVASSTGNWLSIDTSTGSTPKTINVSIVPANIPAGAAGAAPLTGTVSIQPTGALAGLSPTIVNVTLTVAATPVPQPSTITSGAGNTPGAVAPGEFITIKGANLGPTTPASFTLNGQGGVSSTLAGVQVMFDTIAGTPTYVSATQINVVVPYEIAGRASTNITVVYQGGTSAPIPQQVVAVEPSIFTFNATGQGQAVAGNVTGPSAGTDNGPAGGVALTGGTLATSPATAGSFFFVYLTGGGVTNPAGATGSVNSSTTLMPIANWTTTSGTVSATIGGVPANVSFAGAAPGVVTGVYQLDIQVPAGVSGSALPLAITIDGVTTPSGPTIAVQ